MDQTPVAPSLSDTACFYSIGYGNRNIKDFLSILKKYQINYLIDIRSKPYSKYNKLFSIEPLQQILNQNKIKYAFMGDTLGGRPADRSCYVNGYVDYKTVQEKPFFRTGIKRLLKAWHLKLKAALMCSEKKPQECHRSKLLGSYIQQMGINLLHIDENQNLITQKQALQRLNNSQMLLTTENTRIVLRSRNQYA